VLFDPALSERCSPVQWFGPSRFTNVPCAVEDIPAVDAIVLSHNHYDHMDANTLKTLNARHAPHVFVPLGNEPWLRSFGYPKERIHCLDWWDVRSLSLALPPAHAKMQPIDVMVEITCSPAQHQTNRSFNDRWRTLWSSWVLKASTGQQVYFAGDTSYRTVQAGENEDAVPRCPVFKEIGEKFGHFELALLPIGYADPVVEKEQTLTRRQSICAKGGTIGVAYFTC
jgi:N-acyl-phosphatidylethanolamine-hydrolysing phospholipase D